MAQHTRGYVRWLSDIGSDDVASVGGKNASLGEMLQHLEQHGIRVPGGFATTTEAYWAFVGANDLEEVIRERIRALHDGADLGAVGEAIRSAFSEGGLPDDVEQAVREAYGQLSRRYDVEAVIGCFASLFTHRAIAYREEHDFDHLAVALSAGVQKMVRSDLAGAGVAFTIDTETGFPDVVTIEAAWGLGEVVVSGETNPDAYVAFTPLLADEDLRPILSKELGGKNVKIVYGGDGESTRTVDTSKEERRAFVLDDDEILHPRALVRRDRAPLRPPDGHRVGQRRRDG